MSDAVASRRRRTAPALLACAAVVAGAAAGCRKHETAVENGLTGINLTIEYDPALNLTALAFSGTTSAGDAAFASGSLPNPQRPLTSGAETATIVLPAALGGSAIHHRVAGQTQGKIDAYE